LDIADALNEAFLARIIPLGVDNENVMQFVLNFNQHLPKSSNLVTATIRSLGHQASTFAQQLLVELNAQADGRQTALKLLVDLFLLPDFDPNSLFYSNDLKVLLDILSQRIKNTDSYETRTMISEILERCEHRT